MIYNYKIDLSKTYTELKDEGVMFDVLYRIHKEFTQRHFSKGRLNNIVNELSDIPIEDILRKEPTIYTEVPEIYRKHKEKHGDKACKRGTIYNRLASGWSVERIINTPLLSHGGTQKGKGIKGLWNKYEGPKISYDGLLYRLNKGMSFKDAICPEKIVRKKDNEDGERVFSKRSGF